MGHPESRGIRREEHSSSRKSIEAKGFGMRYAFSTMIRLLLNWLVSALALLLVALVVPGFEVESFGSAMWAALVIGLLNMTIGWLLQLLALPLTILTLGLFYFVVNAVILYLASAFVPGFRIRSFFAAFLGAVVLMLVHFLLRAVL